MKLFSQILLMKVLKLGGYSRTVVLVLLVCWNYYGVTNIHLCVSSLLKKLFNSTIFFITASVSNWWIYNTLKNANRNGG